MKTELNLSNKKLATRTLHHSNKSFNSKMSKNKKSKLKNKFVRELAISLALLLMILLLFAPLISSAQTTDGGGGGGGGSGTKPSETSKPNLGDCVKYPATCGIYLIAYVINSVLGLFVSLGALLMKVALNYNNLIPFTRTFRIGFEISLSIVNLGFVFMLIVIALATILRSQTYGLKKLFVRLILAIILVNFSFAIAHTIIRVTNGLSLWFLREATPQGGPWSMSYSAFVDRITSAFAPQVFNLEGNESNKKEGVFAKLLKVSFIGQAYYGIKAIISIFTDFSSFMQAILNMIFGIVFLLFIAFTMIALAVLFFVRYAALGLLLIIMPFAWLFWTIPSLQGYWSKWWSSFLRWSLFSPISIFFLYLALLILEPSEDFANRLASEPVDPTQEEAANAVARLISDTNGSLVATALQQVTILILVWGGIYTANALSITGASLAMDTVKAASLKTAGWMGSKTAKGARKAYLGLGGERLNQKLATSRSPVLAAVGRKLRDITTGANKKEVEKEREKLEKRGLSPAEAALELQGGMSDAKKLAYLGYLQEKGGLSLVEKIARKELRRGEGQSLSEFIEKNRELFARYGQKGLLAKIQGDPILASVAAIRKGKRENLEPRFIRQTIENLHKKSSDLGYISSEIFATSKEEQKKIIERIGLESEEELKFLQEAIIRGIIQSPFFLAIEKLKKIAKEGRLRDFQQIAQRAGLRVEDFDQQLLGWLKTSPAAKNLGLSIKSFGVKTSAPSASVVNSSISEPSSPTESPEGETPPSKPAASASEGEGK